MSNNNFLKGECRHCAGHLEFPADGAGQFIECPHCGQSTELTALVVAGQNQMQRKLWLGMAAAVMFAVAAFWFLKLKPIPAATMRSSSAPAMTNNSSAAMTTSGYERTNDFTVSAVKLEKTPGSSLVYVTGKVRNVSDRRRFGVKLELGLSDSHENPVGRAKDYQSLMEPGSEWSFKAMVLETNAASAKLNSILEDQ